jgi:hypothetical protein
MGMKISARRNVVTGFSVGVVLIGLLGMGATAAQASTGSTTPPASQACSVELSTQSAVCVPLGENLNQAVFAQTHKRVVVSGGAVGTRLAAVPAAAATTYIVAQFFSYPSYGGSMILQVTNSSQCNGSVFQLTDFAAYGADNDTDSFKSFGACHTKIWDGSNLSGAAYGYSVNAADVGSMRNRASSAQFK